jgi:dynein heavy chain
VVAKEEEAVGKVAASAKAMKDECEAELAEAIPALNAAVAALDTIKKPDIDLLKNMGSPPAAIKLILEAVCVMKDVKPDKIKDPGGGKVDDYFGPAKKMMMDAKTFVEALKSYDKDNIPPRIIKRIREQYIPMEDFTPEKAAKASSACEGLCKWIMARERHSSSGPCRGRCAAAEPRVCIAVGRRWRSTTGLQRSSRPRRRRSPSPRASTPRR